MSSPLPRVPSSDEAMEWITDWDYERVPPFSDHQPNGIPTNMYTKDQANAKDVDMMEEDIGDFNPLSLHSEGATQVDWTAAGTNGARTEEELMYDILPPASHNAPPAAPARSSYQDMAVSWHDDDAEAHSHVDHHDDDSIMSPLEEKEGLLPPLSPEEFGVPSAPSHHTMVQQQFSPTTSQGIFHRQQQLLQEVMQQAPQRPQHCPLPHASDHQQQLFREMRHSIQDRPPKPHPSKPDKEDPIFARQQEIFQQLREHSLHGKQDEAAATPNTTWSSQSPVSVTKTITKAGMDPNDYQKVVTQLTEKSIMERQRAMLQESMKRSLESRQALHIPPTALHNYDHGKLSRVLQDIESSSRRIGETYRQEKR